MINGASEIVLNGLYPPILVRGFIIKKSDEWRELEFS
jgi:hypothetical protein